MKTIGVDLGGTNIKAALVDEQGKILKEKSVKTNLPRPAERVCDDIAALCNELAGGQQMAGIGVGCPGTVDGGMVVYSNNLDWKNFAMGDYLTAKTGLSVRIANDANAVALGEALAGCARGAHSAVILTLGTGRGRRCGTGGQAAHRLHRRRRRAGAHGDSGHTRRGALHLRAAVLPGSLRQCYRAYPYDKGGYEGSPGERHASHEAVRPHRL